MLINKPSQCRMRMKYYCSLFCCLSGGDIANMSVKIGANQSNVRISDGKTTYSFNLQKRNGLAIAILCRLVRIVQNS